MTLLQATCKALSKLNLDDIAIYKTDKVTPLFDYVVIASADSKRQLDGSVSNIEDEVYKNGYSIRGVEGKRGGTWILIDLNDVLVNIFYKEERNRYGLDNMWKNLEIIDFEKVLRSIEE